MLLLNAIDGAVVFLLSTGRAEKRLLEQIVIKIIRREIIPLSAAPEHAPCRVARSAVLRSGSHI